MKLYNYVFYKIYKSMESMGFWAEVRAYFFLLMLNVLLILFGVNLYTIIVKKNIIFSVDDAWIWILALIIAFYNYYFLLYQKKWKAIIKEFDGLPKHKNQIGSLIVWSIILIIIIGYFYSLFYLFQINYE